MTGFKALVIDYGGVLTTPLHDTMQAWCDRDDIDLADLQALLRDWGAAPDAAGAAGNPAHALERGEIGVADFERYLAGRLRTRRGDSVTAEGLVARMFAGFTEATPMVDVVRRVRGAGCLTALLSNSWGMAYDRAEWDSLFDVAVISGEVGMRKPEPAIYRLCADRLGVAPSECVFVDDLGANVKAAAAVGMAGVRHRSVEETVAQLEALLGLDLRVDAA